LASVNLEVLVVLDVLNFVNFHMLNLRRYKG
jgi:hypothetical protein